MIQASKSPSQRQRSRWPNQKIDADEHHGPLRSIFFNSLLGDPAAATHCAAVPGKRVTVCTMRD